ncbi:MAG: UDP-N-acetylglucosamine 2-epimerase [Janthinobacterium lividum]
MRTIGIFTGTRAEFGLLRPLIRLLTATPDVIVKLLVTGTHLAASAGATWQEISNDGMAIDERVEVLFDSDTDTGVYTAMGLGIMRYGDAFKRMAPDIVVVLGDRFEAFAAAAAATVCKIPIAHLHGGELTLGAMDESFRHAITKMSHLHFTSTETHRQRVIQLGESPDRVFDVGALGVENLSTLDLIDSKEVVRRLQIMPSQSYFLVTFHPATLCNDAPEAQMIALLDALDLFPDYAVIFTGSNADAGGMGLNRLLEDRAARQGNRYRFFMSLGSTLYLSAARDAAVVIGNSSSAIIEVPSFGVPSVDIGTRQAGRVRSESVISCDPDSKQIVDAVKRALSTEFLKLCATARNPYAKPGTTAQIARVLLSREPVGLLCKHFQDLS